MNVNLCLFQALQGVICGENELLSVCLCRPVMKHRSISGAEMMSFTAVAVGNSNIINMLKKLRAKLLSKQNTRSNNYDDSFVTIKGLKSIDGVFNHTHSFAAASWYNYLPFGVNKHRFSSSLLMGTKSNSQVGFVSIQIQ